MEWQLDITGDGVMNGVAVSGYVTYVERQQVVDLLTAAANAHAELANAEDRKADGRPALAAIDRGIAVSMWAMTARVLQLETYDAPILAYNELEKESEEAAQGREQQVESKEPGLGTIARLFNRTVNKTVNTENTTQEIE